MKKYVNYISLFTLVLFLSSCDKSTEITESTVDPLIGVWVWTETTETSGTTSVTEVSSDTNTETLILNEDKSCSFTGITQGTRFQACAPVAWLFAGINYKSFSKRRAIRD